MICRITWLVALALSISVTELHASSEIWRDISPLARGVDNKLRHFKADKKALRGRLNLVPHEALGDRSRSIRLPMPDGSLAAFAIVESPIMKPALAARYPDIKTFKVYGIDDPTASGRVDITPQGFHAMLFTAKGRLFIDPDQTSTQADQYLSRYRGDHSVQKFSCGVHQADVENEQDPVVAARSAARIPGRLLEYDLAVAATEEYVVALGGTVTLAQAGIVTAINRINEIFERDLGIRLTLVGNNDQLIENGDNVSFTNGNTFSMLNENQPWLDSQSAKLGFDYDIGHVFGTGIGGSAFLGSVCNNTSKAKGATGLFVPIGDPFYIDFVAHEIGHQFNADHSFNGTTSSCGSGNRHALTAFEPGSGSTIMAYAGICGVESLQLNSDATFHAGSIAQINDFTSGAGTNAGTCFTPIATSPVNNTDPVVLPIANRTIPLQTAFALTGSAVDAESGLVLSYQWDQMDVGTSTNAVNYGTDQGDNPLFRSYLPQNTATRDFPALGTQVQKLYDDAEVVPCQARDLNFRLTARDGDSGQAIEDVRLTVSGNAGPFKVTSQALDETILADNGAFTVDWDVANTDVAPVSCPNVAVELLAFDDTSYTSHTVHTLVASTPNIGSVAITPIADSLLAPARGRLRVRCLNNYFYALSQGNLQFVGSNVAPQTFFDADDIATFFNNSGTTGGVAPVCNAQADVAATDRSSGGGGGGAFDVIWLLLLAGLAVTKSWCRRYGMQ